MGEFQLKGELPDEFLTGTCLSGWHLRFVSDKHIERIPTNQSNSRSVLICIFERGKMLDPSKSSYINVFSIIFEVVSGYVSTLLAIPV